MPVSRYGIVLRAAPCLPDTIIKLAHASNSTRPLLLAERTFISVDNTFIQAIVSSSASPF